VHYVHYSAPVVKKIVLPVYREPVTGPRNQGIVHRQSAINNKLAPKPAPKPTPKPKFTLTLTLAMTLN